MQCNVVIEIVKFDALLSATGSQINWNIEKIEFVYAHILRPNDGDDDGDDDDGI